MATLLEVRRTARASAEAASGASPSPDETRLRAFHRLVETSFRETRAVASYADELGCSVRTLERTTRTWEGATAKDVIAARVLLEAKRQLAHTDLSLEVLAEMLGFSEATQLAKFFRRRAGETPGTFRRRYRGASRTA
jgi:AraC-like DNA-binding protein